MRNDYSTHKYDNPFTGYLYENVMGVSGEDESDATEAGEWFARIGRHILTGDTLGFVDRTSYSRESDAAHTFHLLQESAGLIDTVDNGQLI